MPGNTDDRVMQEKLLAKAKENLDEAASKLHKMEKLKGGEFAIGQTDPGLIAFNAVLHQQDSIEKLTFATSMYAFDEPEVKAKEKKYFAKLSKNSCRTLGLHPGHTIEVTPKFVERHFSKEFIAIIKASLNQYEIVPTTTPVWLEKVGVENCEKGFRQGLVIKYDILDWSFRKTQKKM